MFSSTTFAPLPFSPPLWILWIQLYLCKIFSTSPFTLLCIFIFFFPSMCINLETFVALSSNLLLFSSGGLICYNKSISLLYFLHKVFCCLFGFVFHTDQFCLDIFLYFHEHINNNYFNSISHYSNVWIVCVSIANFLGRLVLLS